MRKAVRPLPLRAAAVSNVGLVEKPGRVEIFCELTCYDRCRLTLLGSVDGGESWMFKIDAGKGDAGERLAEGA